MTIAEFDEQRFGANMQVIYHDKLRDVASIDFEEKLIGLVSLFPAEEDEEIAIDWVRCENCKIV